MLDNIVGSPSTSWRRKETYAVILFSFYCLLTSSKRGPKFLWIRSLNRALQRFSPWQIMAATLTALYTLRHFDKIFGLDTPDHPPGYLYSPEFNRATWIVTGLDAGFATAMSIRPKWLRDICSLVFSVYYFVNGDEADSKIHKFREVCTLDMLRITWDKTDNPYIRAITWPFRPRVPTVRQIVFPRPKHSAYSRPISALLFFDGSESELRKAKELVLDFPGGGFVAMGPKHHEERLRLWAKKLRRPVLSLDYGKAPEYPYPYAIEEGFDAYIAIVESDGRILGMSATPSMILSGDSAGGNLATNVMLQIIESSLPSSPLAHMKLPKPAGLALTYPALDFSFSSWARASHSVSGDVNDLPSSQSDSAILSSTLSLPPSLHPFIGPTDPVAREKGIGMIEDLVEANGRDRAEGDEDWKWTTQRSIVHQQTNLSLFERHQEALRYLREQAEAQPVMRNAVKRTRSRTLLHPGPYSSVTPTELRSDPFGVPKRPNVMVRSRSSSVNNVLKSGNLDAYGKDSAFGRKQLAEMEPRLTMSSKTGYLHDRVITPSMMWAMCLLYLGPNFRPGVEYDYHLSPILAPSELLASFPPVLLQCGGRDPLIDDTMHFGGRLKEAKRQARAQRLQKKQANGGQLPTPSEEPDAAPDAQSYIWTAGDDIDDAEDAVKMQIFPGWSHGYLQMSSIMREAKFAIDDIADWMRGTFERRNPPRPSLAPSISVAQF